MAYVELTKENFEEVITSNDMVVVDYWAEWYPESWLVIDRVE